MAGAYDRSMFDVPAIILTGAIRLYQLTISPAQAFLFGPTGGCRFTPTCSQFAIDAVREHGPIAGSWLVTKRICRCHPLGGGWHDPVLKNGTRRTESGNIPKHAH